MSLPVHVITGFLGAGKTSLLRRLLALPELGDTAVIVNELGEAGLDHLLVEEVLAEDVVLLKSGCVCCSVRGDLKAALIALMERRRRGEIPAFARVAVETTGIADPGPIAATLIADPMLRHQARMGNIVTVVDVPNGLTNLDAFPEALAQIAAADRLVVTKADLASAAETDRLAARLAALNPTASILRLTERDTPDADLLLSDPGNEDARKAEVTRWLAAAARPHAFRADPHPDIAAFVLRAKMPIAWPRFALWLSMLLNRHGANVLRLKGVLDLEGVESPVVIQGVQHQIHAPQHLAAWPGPRETTIVVIAKRLDPALVKRSFRAFVAPGAHAPLVPAKAVTQAAPAAAGCPPSRG